MLSQFAGWAMMGRVLLRLFQQAAASSQSIQLSHNPRADVRTIKSSG